MIIAPNRRRRPGAAVGVIEPATDEELGECPFCGGYEDRTPPETFRVPGPDGWLARVVPNLYPAFERQEVAVHSRRHVRSFAELTDGEVTAVATAWRARAKTAIDEGFPYLHVLVNEGRAAGASLPHSHSQLVYLREPPPAVLAEREQPGCGVCATATAGAELVIAEDDGAVALAHPVGRFPYELLIAAPHGDLDLDAALRLLRECVRALRAVEGPVPWNAWLHELFQGGETHPHLEVVPRLSVMAGVELGAEIYVNTVAPEDAAAALRRAMATPPSPTRQPGSRGTGGQPR